MSGALAIARSPAASARVLDSLFMSPLVLPALAFGFAALMTFSAVGWTVSTTTLVIGHTVVCVPYVIRTTTAALAQMDPALLESSASLGASRLYTFRRVTLPLIRPGVLADGFIASWSVRWACRAGCGSSHPYADMRASTGAAAATSFWLGAVLALAAFSLMVVLVLALAPALAAESGLPAAFVGAYSAAVWAAAIVSSLASPALLVRFCAWRLSQGCLLLCAAGVVAVLGGSGWSLAVGALLIGLGHGLEGPAAAQLLSAHVPAACQPLWFSVKQTGVQVGAVLASAALPALALLAGWRTAALLAAALAAAGALLLAVPRRRHPLPHGVAVAGPGLGALVLLRRSRVLRSLALAAAAFGAVQVYLNSFFVTFAVAERGATLVDAGRWLAAAQVGGLVGRLLWGWVGLRPGAAIPLVAALGLGMAVCAASRADTARDAARSP